VLCRPGVAGGRHATLSSGRDTALDLSKE
jgi:hypothetical protein